MNTMPNLFDFEEMAPPPAPLGPGPAECPGYWKQTSYGPELAVLNVVPGDGAAYHPATFLLASGVAVGTFAAGFGMRGLSVLGEAGLISLHDAVRRQLAKELRAEREATE